MSVALPACSAPAPPMAFQDEKTIRYQPVAGIENGPFAGVEGVGAAGYPFFRNRCFIMAREGTKAEKVAELKELYGKILADQEVTTWLNETMLLEVDTKSWEDWLNETHAEWSALLYALDTAPDLFDCLIAELQERYAQRAVALHPADNSRPQDVHSAGAWLYYGIYQQYGRGAIEMLLRIFSQMEVKTTACFISSVAQQSKEIADVLLRASDINVL